MDFLEREDEVTAEIRKKAYGFGYVIRVKTGPLSCLRYEWSAWTEKGARKKAARLVKRQRERIRRENNPIVVR